MSLRLPSVRPRRRARPRRAAFPTLVASACVSACASARGGGFPADATARPATGTPGAFAFAAPPAGSACRSPARDPRDGATVTLARSSGGRGDYEVPAGRYGVGGREYLRLDCATGAVVGVVPR